MLMTICGSMSVAKEMIKKYLF